MESTTTTPSLKKLKREAAQRRKAQARSLKLCAEEQERLQRLEIDALVEQQRLQRLERQRRKEDAEKLAQEVSRLSVDNIKPKNQQQIVVLDRYEDGKKAKEPVLAWPCKKDNHIGGVHVLVKQDNQQQKQQEQQHQQQQQQQQQQEQHQQQMLRTVAENRRRLARVSRNTSLLAPTESISSSSPITTSSLHQSQHQICTAGTALPVEDHRVVSTEYQAAGTQALMRVTLLAAGFVIGARGISARLIGQMTGAIIQSWTESSPSLLASSTVVSSSSPSSSSTSSVAAMRLFRIQGKKAVVQAAVSLVEQAVNKYKELCECKRRGEFVQREHIINGVEFYYQPPPRKAFTAHPPLPPPISKPIAPTSTLPYPPHHVWLHHLQQHQQQQQQQLQQQQQKQQQQICVEKNIMNDAAAAEISNNEASCIIDDQQQRHEDLSLMADVITTSSSASSSSSSSSSSPSSPSSSSSSNTNTAAWMGCSSLFSIFGNGGLPLPIAQDCGHTPTPTLLKSHVSSTPFDFPKYDFFTKLLPTAFPALVAPIPHPPPAAADDYHTLFSPPPPPPALPQPATPPPPPFHHHHHHHLHHHLHHHHHHQQSTSSSSSTSPPLSSSTPTLAATGEELINFDSSSIV